MKYSPSLFLPRLTGFLLISALLSLPAALMSAQDNSAEGAESQLKALGFEMPRESFQAPDFSLEDLQGNTRNLKDYRGKLVMLNFWATWCPPCRAEMPSMEQLYQEMRGEDFVMLAVNLREGRTKVAGFTEEEGYNFPVLLDKDGQVGSQLYGVQAIPTTYLIAPDGTILGRKAGTREWDTPEIKSLFNSLMP